MNELMYYHGDPWLRLFSDLEASFGSMCSGFENSGLKRLIHRPHNLLTNKDKDGNIVSYSLEVVYTPFKKSDVKIEVLNNNLTVKCGSENKTAKDGTVYNGISRQAYSFSIPLSEYVDVNNITAKAEDGILYITLPVLQPTEKKNAPMQIEIQ